MLTRTVFRFPSKFELPGFYCIFDKMIGGSGLSQSHFRIELDVTKTGSREPGAVGGQGKLKGNGERENKKMGTKPN